MKKSMFFIVIALSAVMVSCGKSTQANEEKEELSQPASQEISAIRTANDLAKYGYEVALLAAKECAGDDAVLLAMAEKVENKMAAMAFPNA